MSAYFFDSSSLLKRYINETGSTWVQATTLASVNHRIYIAQITPIEVMSAINRRKREGAISDRSTQAARILLERHALRQYDTIYLVNSIEILAKDLLHKHPLRAADAIQLASALIANNRLLAANQTPLIFVTNDERLEKVALQENIAIYFP